MQDQDVQVWTIVLGAVGVLVTALVPVALHRATHRRRQVSFAVTYAPLPNAPQLAVASVRLWASGRSDVASSMFDGGRPVTVRFAAPIVDGIRPFVQELPGWGFERDGADRLVLRPSLIGRGSVHGADVVVPAGTAFRLHHALVDTKVVLEQPRSAARRRRVLGGMAISAIVAGVGFLLYIVAIFAVLAGDDWLALATAISLVSILLFLGGVVGVVVLAIVRLVQYAIRRS